MIKKILLFMFLFVFLQANADKPQDFFNNSDHLKIGILAGINASSVWASDTKNIIYKVGLSGGIMSVKKLSDNLHLRMEILYINKGFKTSRIKDEDYIDKKHRYYFITEYLDFPIMLQFFMPVQKYGTNWMAGLAPSLNITTRQKTKIDDEVIKSSIENKNRFFDLNLIVGTNIMTSEKWYWDLRASAGLLPIYQESDFWGRRNISFLLSLGYFFK